MPDDNNHQDPHVDNVTTDTLHLKANIDNSVADATELMSAFDQATATAAEYKADLERMAVNCAEQQQQLDKASADAACMRSRFNKLTVDSAEQKTQLDKATVNASRLKAALDKATADAAEHRVNMHKLLLDSARQKDQLDKATADAADQKADLNRAAAEAAEFKAGFVKALADGFEQKAQIDKLTANAAELKASFDSLTLVSNQQSAQLHKATADAAQYKANWDKATADVAEYKAGRDKATADAAEYKAGRDKATADAAEYKAGWDQAAADAEGYKAEMDKMTLDMSHMQSRLDTERENYSTLHDRHAELLQQQEVLTAELMIALGSYQPKAAIDSGTPADKLLQMITDLLDGTLPNLQDLLLVQSSILEAHDIYQPWHLGKQLMETKGLEQDVGASLAYLLGESRTVPAQSSQPGSLPEQSTNRCATSEPTLDAIAVERVRRTSAAICELDIAGQDADLPDMLSAICSASTSHSLGHQELSNVRDRRRSSSLSVKLAAVMDMLDEDGSDLPTSAGQASQLLQRLAMRRSKNSERPSATQSSVSNIIGVGTPATANAASVRHGFTSSRTRAAWVASTLEGDLDSCASESTDAAAESACTDYSDASFKMPDCKPHAPAVADHLLEVLSSAYEWQFDAFALNEVSKGHPLSTLGYFFFHQQKLNDQFNLAPANLARCLRRLEDGYKSNPYHNATHAADVLQTMHTILTRGGLLSGYVDGLHLMACYIAAIVHDYEHCGLTNDFLINSLDDLAMLYNDRSPLENHHLAAAFAIMRQSGLDFAKILSKTDFEKFRKVVIELVLATDMKQHFSSLTQFSTMHRLNASGAATPSSSSDTGSQAELRQLRQRSDASSSTHCSRDMEEIVLPLDENERILTLQMALKCADVGHVAAALPVHVQWVQRLEEEFFCQGDIECKIGMTVSPLFDRAKQGISKSQVGFFDVVVIPLFHAFAQVFHNCRPLLTYVMRNYQYWAEVQAKEAKAGASPDKDSSSNEQCQPSSSSKGAD